MDGSNELENTENLGLSATSLSAGKIFTSARRALDDLQSKLMATVTWCNRWFVSFKIEKIDKFWFCGTSIWTILRIILLIEAKLEAGKWLSETKCLTRKTNNERIHIYLFDFRNLRGGKIWNIYLLQITPEEFGLSLGSSWRLPLTHIKWWKWENTKRFYLVLIERNSKVVIIIIVCLSSTCWAPYFHIIK